VRRAHHKILIEAQGGNAHRGRAIRPARSAASRRPDFTERSIHDRIAKSILRGSAVTGNNVLYFIIGALVIAVAVLGYELYQANKQPPEGVHIDIGPKGLSIEKK
jgi:hypothetical protein